MPTKTLGTVLIVSGPSGAGKTTLCKRLLAAEPNLAFSVSCTTRPPRPGEVDGVDYHFFSRADFEEKLSEGAFLEHAEVHGNLYGTLVSEVEERIQTGTDVLLDIDVQGARQVREHSGGTLIEKGALYVFIGPPSVDEMQRRLRGRGTEAPEVVARRLANAKGELAAWREYAYVVVNDDLEEATTEFRTALAAARLRCTLYPHDATPWQDGSES